MNSNAIEFQGLNLLPALHLKDLDRDRPVIRPVQKGSKSMLETDPRRAGAYSKDRLSEDSSELSEEDVRRAADIMAGFLRELPDFESSWKYDVDHGIFVIQVKNRMTGQVIRQIPPEEILSGMFVLAADTSGNIINRTA